MAGVKGRCGGPRPNSGGARPGAGRKPKPPVPQPEKDMLQLLIDVALGRTEANALQVRAAVAAVQYTHVKTHDGGRKDDRQRKADEVSAGQFGQAKAPRLVVNNR